MNTSTQSSTHSGTSSHPQEVAVNLAAVLPQLQNPDPNVVAAAIDALKLALRNEPNNPLALYGMGIAQAQRQQWDSAAEFLEKAISADPKFAAPHSSLGNIHRIAGRRDEAEKSYRQALLLQPSLPDAHYNLSLLLDEEGKTLEAEECLKRAILFRPTYPEAHNNLGHLFLKKGQTETAVSHFRQALVWNPELKQARTNLILALYRLGRCTEAQAETDKALKQWPGDASILRTQAAGLAFQGLLDDAQQVNRKILELEPDAPDIQLNMGELLLSAEDYEGALTLYRKLLNEKGIHPILCINAMGNVLLAQGNFSEARDMFRQGLMVEERLPTLTVGLAKALLETGDTPLAIQTFRRASELLPESAEVHSQLIHALYLDPRATDEEKVVEIQRWLKKYTLPNSATPIQPIKSREWEGGGAIRVGFLIGDIEKNFRGKAIESLCTNLSAKNIECRFYQSAGKIGSRIKRIQKKFPHWLSISSLSSDDLRNRIRDDTLDILVDTIGHNYGNRLTAMVCKAAPVQVSWLGDFVSTQLPDIGYILTDQNLTQGTSAAGETAPLFLPSAVCLPPPKKAPLPTALPALEAGFLTFGSIAPLSHINSQVLDTWAAILLKLPSARLRIVTNTAQADKTDRERLKKLIMMREIEPERVDILPSCDEDHLPKHISTMDVMLDTFPYPLGFGALDCLWMGVPIITIAGAAPFQRTTFSLLSQADLANWGVSTSVDYVEKAVALESDIESLAALRQELRQRLSASPVCDEKGFAKAFTATLRSLVSKTKTKTRKQQTPQ